MTTYDDCSEKVGLCGIFTFEGAWARADAPVCLVPPSVAQSPRPPPPRARSAVGSLRSPRQRESPAPARRRRPRRRRRPSASGRAAPADARPFPALVAAPVSALPKRYVRGIAGYCVVWYALARIALPFGSRAEVVAGEKGASCLSPTVA